MLPYRTVLFDFDYTLGDSSRGLVASVNAALTALNYPVPKPDPQGIHLAMRCWKVYRKQRCMWVTVSSMRWRPARLGLHLRLC